MLCSKYSLLLTFINCCGNVAECISYSTISEKNIKAVIAFEEGIVQKIVRHVIHCC